MASVLKTDIVLKLSRVRIPLFPFSFSENQLESEEDITIVISFSLSPLLNVNS